MPTPVRPRRTSQCSMGCFITADATAIGTAKSIPTLATGRRDDGSVDPEKAAIGGDPRIAGITRVHPRKTRREWSRNNAGNGLMLPPAGYCLVGAVVSSAIAWLASSALMSRASCRCSSTVGKVSEAKC